MILIMYYSKTILPIWPTPYFFFIGLRVKNPNDPYDVRLSSLSFVNKTYMIQVF